jgi:hypothetical protein
MFGLIFFFFRAKGNSPQTTTSAFLPSHWIHLADGVSGRLLNTTQLDQAAVPGRLLTTTQLDQAAGPGRLLTTTKLDQGAVPCRLLTTTQLDRAAVPGGLQLPGAAAARESRPLLKSGLRKRYHSSTARADRSQSRGRVSFQPEERLRPLTAKAGHHHHHNGVTEPRRGVLSRPPLGQQWSLTVDAERPTRTRRPPYVALRSRSEDTTALYTSVQPKEYIY